MLQTWTYHGQGANAVHRILRHVTQSQTLLCQGLTLAPTSNYLSVDPSAPLNGRTLAPTNYQLLPDAFSKANGFPRYQIPEHPQDYLLLTSVGKYGTSHDVTVKTNPMTMCHSIIHRYRVPTLLWIPLCKPCRILFPPMVAWMPSQPTFSFILG
jgi:hypothetical protein